MNKHLIVEVLYLDVEDLKQNNKKFPSPPCKLYGNGVRNCWKVNKSFAYNNLYNYCNYSSMSVWQTWDCDGPIKVWNFLNSLSHLTKSLDFRLLAVYRYCDLWKEDLSLLASRSHNTLAPNKELNPKGRQFWVHSSF